MAGLSSVHIKRFKNIADTTFEIKAINVIVGANNSGKSSVLEALHFAVSAIQSLKLEGLLNKDGVLNSVNPASLIYVPSDDVHALGSGGRLWEQANKSVQIELNLTSGHSLTMSMRKGRNRNITISVSDVAIAKGIASIETPFSIFTPGLAGIAKAEHYVSDGVLLRTIARGDANLVLRNTLLRLWGSDKGQNTKWREFTADLNRVFPSIKVSVSFTHQSDEFINVGISAGVNEIPLELSGTGVLQSIQVLSYIHYFNPQVIVLDEPDSHLHPNNQRLLCSLLNTIAQNGQVQVILSTHSRHVLDSLQGTANFLWAQNGVVSPVENGRDLAILLDLGALDIKESIPVGLPKCLVLTEDETIIPLKAILEASGFDMSKTIIQSYYGCTHPHNLRPLINIIKDVNTELRIIVHRDRDYLDEKEIADWRDELRSMDAEWFITDGVDIESHFLIADHLVAANSNLTQGEAVDLINRALIETRERSIEKYVNSRCDIEKKAGTFGKVNLGELATQAPKDYDANTSRYSYSKTVMARIRHLYQTGKGQNLVTYVPSVHVVASQLSELAKQIFNTPSTS